MFWFLTQLILTFAMTGVDEIVWFRSPINRIASA